MAATTSWTLYLEAHRRRRRQAAEEAAARAERARRAATAAAERLARELAVRRVILFGSLARGAFGERSDIDLAVEGLAPGKLVEALVTAGRDCEFAVDVVPLDHAPPYIRQAVISEGIALWPR